MCTAARSYRARTGITLTECFTPQRSRPDLRPLIDLAIPGQRAAKSNHEDAHACNRLGVWAVECARKSDALRSSHLPVVQLTRSPGFLLISLSLAPLKNQLRPATPVSLLALPSSWTVPFQNRRIEWL